MELGRKERGKADRDGDRRREGGQTGMEIGRKERGQADRDGDRQEGET